MYQQALIIQRKQEQITEEKKQLTGLVEKIKQRSEELNKSEKQKKLDAQELPNLNNFENEVQKTEKELKTKNRLAKLKIKQKVNKAMMLNIFIKIFFMCYLFS